MKQRIVIAITGTAFAALVYVWVGIAQTSYHYPKPKTSDPTCRMVDSYVDDLKVGQCGWLWIVFRDADGTYLAFRPEAIRKAESKFWSNDYRVEMRSDGLHVWLHRGEDITRADAPLWEPMFIKVKTHTD